MTSKKRCEECGKEINMKRIHILWFPDLHSFLWICGDCKIKCQKKKI